MDHEAVGRGTVPVLLIRGSVDDVAGVSFDDVAATGLDQGDALDDVEGLAQGVGVPGGAGAGSEPVTMLARIQEGSSPRWITSA